MSDILKHLIIDLSDVFGVSSIVNDSIIQQFDISSMSDILKHLINYSSNVSGAERGDVFRGSDDMHDGSSSGQFGIL